MDGLIAERLQVQGMCKKPVGVTDRRRVCGFAFYQIGVVVTSETLVLWVYDVN
jgi:hypothetical protein